MARNENFEMLRDYIEERGGTGVSIDVNRRHPRIYFSYRGVTKFIVIGATISDVRAMDNAKSTVNELFSFIREITPNFMEVPRAEVRDVPRDISQETFGERLQFAREQQQLTRERLADLSGVDEDLIQRFEITRQSTLRDFTTALLLSSALNLSLSYLVGEQVAKEFKPMTALGDAISKYRVQKNMSLIGLAERAGISVQQLANIETGLFNPALPNIDAIAKALEVKREELTRESPVETQPAAAEAPAPTYNDINTLEDFARFIRFLRERKGLKQMDVAEALGMSYPAEVSRVERGIWASGVYTRHEVLSKVLGVAPGSMKAIIDRVTKDARPAPKPRVIAPSQPKPVVAPSEPVRVIPKEFASAVTQPEQPSPVLSFDSEKLATAIREQAEITRALLRDQHNQLLEAIKQISVKAEFNVADVMHTVVDNLFTKRKEV